MKKQGRVLTSWLVVFVVLLCGMVGTSPTPTAEASEKTISQAYAEAMGTGINLGNSFDSFDRVENLEIDDETAWGNPVVTRAYIDDLKEKGFDSIRIPFTTFTRTDDNYTINEAFFSRYEEVVNYALDAGFYVMINLHHDASEWLKYWDGNHNSDEYERFVVLWGQLAERFKNYGDHLMFESINEVCFEKAVCPTEEEQNERVKDINLAFYNIVRNSGGNNATRMLVLPTTYTNDQLMYSEYLADYMMELNDPNMIATVHYYSTSIYAFTPNIGLPGFDEEHWGTTARKEIDVFYDRLKKAFIDNGIGVAIGEYGLFGMGRTTSLNDGEVYKYFEYMNYKARELGISPMVWECGNIINRNTGEYLNQTWGDILQGSQDERCSYSTGFNHEYVTNSTRNEDISIPLTLNGNKLTAIYDGATSLVEGVDYQFENDTVTLLAGYVASIATGEYGVKADLVMEFSAGSVWHHYISYEGTAVFQSVNAPIRKDDGFMATYDTDMTPTYPAILIPVDYNGKQIKKIASYNSAGEVKSANSWANSYMESGGEFVADYHNNLLALMNWYNNAIPDDTYTLKIDFYDGTAASYSFVKENGNITGAQVTQSNVEYSLTTDAEWGTGCRSVLTVTNTTGKNFTNGWTLEFDYDREITDVYDADFGSEEKGHVILTNPSWNQTWNAGETKRIVFIAGQGNSSAVISNCVLK